MTVQHGSAGSRISYLIILQEALSWQHKTNTKLLLDEEKCSSFRPKKLDLLSGTELHSYTEQ